MESTISFILHAVFNKTSPFCTVTPFRYCLQVVNSLCEVKTELRAIKGDFSNPLLSNFNGINIHLIYTFHAVYIELFLEGWKTLASLLSELGRDPCQPPLQVSQHEFQSFCPLLLGVELDSKEKEKTCHFDLKHKDYLSNVTQ